MATSGITLVTLAMVDKNQKLITGDAGLSESGLLDVTTSLLGTKTANITGLQAAGTLQYGNNYPVWLSSSKGAPTVALEFNNLPFEILQKAVGRKLVDGGWQEMGDKPHLALMIKTQSIDRMNFVYYTFGNGQLVQESLNNGTDTNAETIADDALNYQALSTDAFGGAPFKVYSDVTKTFDKKKMYTAVFGGYTGDVPVDAQGTPSTVATGSATTPSK